MQNPARTMIPLYQSAKLIVSDEGQCIKIAFVHLQLVQSPARTITSTRAWLVNAFYEMANRIWGRSVVSIRRVAICCKVSVVFASLASAVHTTGRYLTPVCDTCCCDF